MAKIERPKMIKKTVLYNLYKGEYEVVTDLIEIDYDEVWKTFYFKGPQTNGERLPTPYKISNYGRVKGPNDQIRPLYYDKDGYTRFSVWIPKNDPIIKNEKSIRYAYKTHRAVAEAFVKNEHPNWNKLVMHKNDIRDCNFYTNLVWGNPNDNMQDKIVKGRLRVLHGSNKPDSKFKEADVIEICELLASGHKNNQEIIYLLGKSKMDADYLNSYNNLIQNVKCRHCWREITEKYEY